MLAFALFFSAVSIGSADTGPGVFTIDPSCLSHEGDHRNWSRFPSDPNAYSRAAASVSTRMKTCLSGINRDVADEITRYIARVGKIRIVCEPSQVSSSIECAHVTPGSPDIVLTGPRDCGSLENTIFHELLHLATHLDDMTAAHHNDPSCRSYDAIYACSEICFASAPTLRKAGIGWFGCKACVTNSGPGDRVCGRLPIEFDINFQTCRPRGY